MSWIHHFHLTTGITKCHIMEGKNNRQFSVYFLAMKRGSRVLIILLPGTYESIEYQHRLSEAWNEIISTTENEVISNCSLYKQNVQVLLGYNNEQTNKFPHPYLLYDEMNIYMGSIQKEPSHLSQQQKSSVRRHIWSSSPGMLASMLWCQIFRRRSLWSQLQT